MANDTLEYLTAQYRRLALAEDDFQEARAMAIAILELSLHSRPKETLDVQHRALSLAAVISYGRAFVESKSSGGSAIAKFIPKSLLKTLTPAERELHSKLLRLRHQELAHSDLAPLNLEISLVEGGDVSIYSMTRVPLSKREVKLLKSMSEKLIDAILDHQATLRAQLPAGLTI